MSSPRDSSSSHVGALPESTRSSSVENIAHVRTVPSSGSSPSLESMQASTNRLPIPLRLFGMTWKDVDRYGLSSQYSTSENRVDTLFRVPTDRLSEDEYLARHTFYLERTMYGVASTLLLTGVTIVSRNYRWVTSSSPVHVRHV